jgi:hypothetical protein
MFLSLPFTAKRSALRSMPVGRAGQALVLAGLLSLGVAGCATGDVVMLATIAGGEQVRVPLGRGGPVMTNEGGVRIDAATFVFNKDKKVLYVFAFTDSRNRALRSIRVEDVSDTAPLVLLDEAQPKLSAIGEWRGESTPLESGDPRMDWFTTITNSVRVYRFTFTFADGQTLVLLQGAMFPAQVKAAVRQAYGQKY